MSSIVSFGGSGAQGEQGPKGDDAHTVTTVDFDQPASGSVVVIVESTAFMSAGLCIYISTAGYYTVQSVDSATACTLVPSKLEAVAASTVASGKKVSPAGISTVGYGGYKIIAQQAGLTFAEDYYGVGSWLTLPSAGFVSGADYAIGVPAGQTWKIEYSLSLALEYGASGTGELSADMFFILVECNSSGAVNGPELVETRRYIPRSEDPAALGDLSTTKQHLQASTIVYNSSGSTKYYKLFASVVADGQSEQSYQIYSAAILATRMS